jgi:hypothetical protein
MTPTNELRFVERVVPAPEYGQDMEKTVRILQQKWEKKYQGLIPNETQWRDVPVLKEQK